MASPILTVGDTYPPIRGCAQNEDGLLNLATADEVKFVAVSQTNVFEGDAAVLDPPEDVNDPASALGFNWEYTLAADDTATAGTYTPWLKITWDATATPPTVEWVKGGDTITVQDAPE